MIQQWHGSGMTSGKRHFSGPAVRQTIDPSFKMGADHQPSRPLSADELNLAHDHVATLPRSSTRPSATCLRAMPGASCRERT